MCARRPRRGRAIVRWSVTVLAATVGVALVVALLGMAMMFRMPGRSWTGPASALESAELEVRDRLRRHVEVLARDIGPRHVGRYEALAAAANYIEVTLEGLGYETRSQSYQVGAVPVRNIEVELTGGRNRDELLVLGAHYDTVPGCPGADDNASGVAALLELARLLRQSSPGRTVRFVAFVNEEYPYFQTEHMGSVVYAEAARARGDRIVGMLSLETMGYFRDWPGSQTYPFPLRYFYPDRGDFIGFVGNLRSGTFVRRTVAAFRRSARVPSEATSAPGGIPGLGWSDHWAFWQVGYPAVMITDTALFRYPHYHRSTDIPEQLDYDRLTRVVVGLADVVIELAAE